MKVLLSLLMFIFLAVRPADAVTLDFTIFPKGTTAGPLQFSDVATVQSEGGALFVYGDGDFGMPNTGGICALQSDFTCTGEFSLLFIGPVSDLSFKGFFAGPSDKAVVTAYVGDQRLATQLVLGNASEVIDVSFAGFSGITRVDIAVTSKGSSKGIAYGDFDFETGGGGPTPPRLPERFLTFDTIGKGVNGPVLDLDGVKVSAKDGGNLFVYHTGDFSMPDNGGVCAVQANFTCMGDLLVEFDTPVFDLMFSGFFARPTDSAFISIFNGTLLVFSGTFNGNSGGTVLFDFRNVGLLTSLLIEDRSNADTKGMAFGDFRFTVAQPTPIPLPASVLFLAAAAAGLALLKTVGRRRIA